MGPRLPQRLLLLSLVLASRRDLALVNRVVGGKGLLSLCELVLFDRLRSHSLVMHLSTYHRRDFVLVRPFDILEQLGRRLIWPKVSRDEQLARFSLLLVPFAIEGSLLLELLAKEPVFILGRGLSHLCVLIQALDVCEHSVSQAHSLVVLTMKALLVSLQVGIHDLLAQAEV